MSNDAGLDTDRRHLAWRPPGTGLRPGTPDPSEQEP